MNKMLNIVLFGPPGAGKGTQAENIIDRYHLFHISTGDVFRRNMREETPLGALAKQFIEKGQLVPDTVTVDMLAAEMDRAGTVPGFIFDGFPRTVTQAQALDKMLAGRHTSVTLMISLEVGDEELKKRLAGRAAIGGRADDADPDVIENRIAVYKSETYPVRDYYEAQLKMRAIEGIGTVEEIFARICRAID